MGLLRTIAILVIIYYAFKFFSRYIAPIFLKKVISKAEKKFREQQNMHNENETTGNVGETVIAKKAPSTKESNKSVGDYVDYEEIND
ncbi:protein of unknown function [Lutibacter oricola]|uniref:DUF4834 domain-containing protein n=1 Tax=Lutibacter oricola TaxID=762486 RepID=A0A1H3CBL3_9FLAO|nr:DUF4834 family protein [Lutibacter oricola]SDX51268.1 protein of unknown function [Lutibacter oricola]